jgi:hypothetical protein
VAVRGRNESNDYSAGNYQLIDKESTGRMVILPGITSSCYKPGNYQLMDEKESTEGIVFLPGITSS